MTKNDEKIAALLARRDSLEARIKRLKLRESAAERKARAHALLLLGVALEKQLQTQPGSMHMVRQIISAHLKEREQAAVTDYLFVMQSDQQHSESGDP